jgi:hypothetical protein
MTVVVPFDGAQDYLALMGVAISPDGLAFETERLSQLAARAAEYEALLLELQTDVDWFARLNFARVDSQGIPEEPTLWIGYERKLTIQPEFEAIVTLFVYPMFSGPPAVPITSEAREYELGSRLIKKDKALVEFDSLMSTAERAIQEHYGELGIDLEHLDGFMIRARVGSMEGRGYVRSPGEQNVCFFLRRSGKHGALEQEITAHGTHCPTTSWAE